MFAVLAVLGSAAGCADDEPDAYGTFEAIEVQVSAEVGGTLLRFEPGEGAQLAAETVVGAVDTAALALQRQELLAQQRTTRARATESTAQIDVLQAQLSTAVEEYERTLRLYRAEAATAQQLNRSEGEVRVLRERIEAARAQTGVVREETGTVQARIDQIDERIRKSRIVNPLAGTVLATYAEPGEFVQPGQPLYRIASLDTLILRAYVAEEQLARLRIGERVTVRFDAGGGELATLAGRLTWISAKAEFTPTPIQTRDERAVQVYAVKIRVPNDGGALKIGMPGEVVFADASPEEELAASRAIEGSRTTSSMLLADRASSCL